ncbi:MAG: tetraacyldisaccharide 4-kinase [Campylobacterota bacterium]|nr:tetraacyldisaccharide 4-kinase [Campylobacterota bacterium]
MKRLITFWVEGYFYRPSRLQKLLSFLLYPLSLLYCFAAWIRYVLSTPKDFGIPIVSVGNLTVGGSGKTPLVSALCALYEKPAIVLRGYGRDSKGLVVVRDANGIACDISQSGDEAMLYAQTLSHAVVIVSEKRQSAIELAKLMGCEAVFLDDGYGKHSIQKLDLVIDVETPNAFCLPSGPYRERLWSGKNVIMVDENRSFVRHVEVQNATPKMALVTAIARPQRLDPYLPKVVDKIYFEDHHFFTREELEAILKQTGSSSLLVTQKDFVKIAPFNLPISLLELSLVLNPELIDTVREYVHAKKD